MHYNRSSFNIYFVLSMRLEFLEDKACALFIFVFLYSSWHSARPIIGFQVKEKGKHLHTWLYSILFDKSCKSFNQNQSSCTPIAGKTKNFNHLLHFCLNVWELECKVLNALWPILKVWSTRRKSDIFCDCVFSFCISFDFIKSHT